MASYQSCLAATYLPHLHRWGTIILKISHQIPTIPQIHMVFYIDVYWLIIGLSWFIIIFPSKIPF